MSGSERAWSKHRVQLHAGKLARVQIVFVRLTWSDLEWRRLSGARARIYDSYYIILYYSYIPLTYVCIVCGCYFSLLTVSVCALLPYGE